MALSVAGLGAEEVEAEALVVDALGVAAGVVVGDREHLAAELAHALRGRLDVVDAEVEARPRDRRRRLSMPAGGVIDEMWNAPGW